MNEVLELLEQVCESYSFHSCKSGTFDEPLDFRSSLIHARYIAAGILADVFEPVNLSEYQGALRDYALRDYEDRKARGVTCEIEIPVHLNVPKSVLLTGYCAVQINGELCAFRTGHWWRVAEIANRLAAIIQCADELLCLLDDCGDDGAVSVKALRTAEFFADCYGWLQGLEEHYFAVKNERLIREDQRARLAKGAEIVNEPYTNERAKWTQRVRELEETQNISRTKAIAQVHKKSGVGKSTLWRYFTIERQIAAESQSGRAAAQR
jgi:hypothetical protein